MAFKIQLKQGPGWFSVEADDYDRFYTDLCVVFGQVKADEIIASVQSSEGGAAPAATAPAPQAPAAPQPGLGSASWGAPPAPPSAPPAPPAAPAAPQAPAGGPPAGFDNPPFCQHGQRRAVSYTSKSGRDAGKQKYMFFCPLPQDQREHQCKAIDAVTGEEWGRK